MKLVHIADLHLGYRQYQRQTPSGLNQREADIAKSFRTAIDKIIEIRPDVVLVAGDVFHSVRPTNPAIIHAWLQFSRLREMLPDTDIVMVSGNHDNPRTRETGSILRLFTSLGIQVVEGESKNVRFPDKNLNILAVPFGARETTRFEPDTASKYNVLLIHDIVEGLLHYAEPASGISMKTVHADLFDYVAFGHYHVYRPLAPNAFYSGAIDYTGSNIWGEIDEASTRRVNGKKLLSKGFIEHNLATGEHEFHQIPGRGVVDLPEINAQGLTAQELSEKIVEVVETHEGGIDDQVVRLIVRDLPRHILRDIDHRKIREFKRRAMHFHLDARKPVPPRLVTASGAPGKRASLTETVRAMLEARPVTPGIDRQALVDLGLRYLDEAERLAPALTGDEA
jgi:DNA repair exonuclease SbcCD nuclease subunit